MTKYNGWTNYETWNIALWIDNEEGVYRYWRKVARQELAVAENKEEAIASVRERLKESFSDTAHEMLDKVDMGSSWMSDLMHAALSEVNWHEIAEHILD